MQWQSEHEIEIVIRRDAVEPLHAAFEAAMHEHVLSVSALEAAGWLHASPTGAHAISRSPVIDMAREQAIGTVVAMMRAGRWRADKPATMPALEHLFSRGSLPAHKTRSSILLFARESNSSVCFSQWWISSFASIGCTSKEASKARQQRPRKAQEQDPSWSSKMTAYT